MQTIAAAVAGIGMESTGAGGAAAKRGAEGAGGAAPDFGIALLAKLQALSIALEGAVPSASRQTAAAGRAGAKEGEGPAEPVASKPSKKAGEDAATAPVEAVAPRSPSVFASPVAVDSAKQAPARQASARSGFDLGGGLAGEAPLARAGKAEPSVPSHGGSPVGVSSPAAAGLGAARVVAAVDPSMVEESTVEESTIKPSTIEQSANKVASTRAMSTQAMAIEPSTSQPSMVAPPMVAPPMVAPSAIEPSMIAPSMIEPSTSQPSTTAPSMSGQSTSKAAAGGTAAAMPAKLGERIAASPTGAGNPDEAAAGVSDPRDRGDGAPMPESAANGVEASPSRSSFFERPGNQSGVEPERDSPETSLAAEPRVAHSIRPETETPISSPPRIAANSPTAAASSVSIPAAPGKGAGKSAATNGSLGGASRPAPAGMFAAAGTAAQGASGLAGGAAPAGAAGLAGVGRPVGAAAVAPGESFRQIDTAAEPPKILRTTPSQFEVGVNDPAHGWVEVRAESASGQIHASLGASSLAAQSALHASLPELAGYLAEREIAVRSLAVDHGARESGSLAQTSGGGAGGQGREFSGGADPNAHGGRGSGQASQSAGGGVADGANRSRAGVGFPESETAMPSAHGRGAAIGYSPHTINVLA